MSFLRHITVKPWVTVGSDTVELRIDDTLSLPAARIGLRVLLVVFSVLFSLFIVSYIDRMTLPDWRPAPEPWLLWLNSAILVMGSVAMQWAAVSARRGRIDGVSFGLIGGGIFALAFLVGQLLAWREMIELGYFAAANPANAFFYLLTALHGLHLLGGLVAWAMTGAKVWRGGGVDAVRTRVELCAVYWHFLLVVWFVLFGLLLLT